MLRIAYAVPSETFHFTVFPLLPPQTSQIRPALTGHLKPARWKRRESWGVVGLPTLPGGGDANSRQGDDAEASLRAVAFPWCERPRSR